MLKRWLQLRKWRKSIRVGDTVMALQCEVKVQSIHEDGSVLVWYPNAREYETYRRRDLYPAEPKNTLKQL